MTLYKSNKILFIVFIALLFFSPRLCNAANTEESAEEILFITSYNFLSVSTHLIRVLIYNTYINTISSYIQDPF